MSTHLSVIPVGTVWLGDTDRLREWYRYELAEYEAEGGQAAWCAARGIELPADVTSRLPTQVEVAHVLRSLAGLRYEISPDEVWVLSYLDNEEAVHLATDDCRDRPDEPCPFFFESGSAALQRFLVGRLSEVCGPLLVRDPPRLLTPETPTPPYWVMPGRDGLRLVRWHHGLPHYQQRETRLLSFAAHETDFGGDYEGMPIFLAAHGIRFMEPPREDYRWTPEEVHAVLAAAPGYDVEFDREYEYDYGQVARVYPATGDRVLLAALQVRGYPNRLCFEPGELRGQIVVAELLARRHGPHVLLPNHLSEVPILVQAGDDPARLLAEWERRTVTLGS